MKEKKIKNLMVLIGVVAIVLEYYLSIVSTNYTKEYSLCLRGLVGVILIINIRIKKSDFFVLLILGMIIALKRNASSVNIFFIFLFIKNMKNIECNFKKIMFYLILLLSIIQILLLKNNFITEVISSNYFEGIIRLRSDLGLKNPNTAFLFFIYLPMYSFLNKNTKIIYKIISVAGAIYMYKQTDSRTSFFIFLLFIAMIYFFKILKKYKIEVNGIKKYIIKLIISLNFAYLYFGVNSEKYSLLNKILSLRLSIISALLKNINLIELFTGAKEVASEPIDNLLVILIWGFGIIIGSIMFLILGNCVIKSIKRISDEEYSFVCSMLVGGIFESFLIRPVFSSVFIFYYIIFKNNYSKIN